jgi:hypothetical protein
MVNIGDKVAVVGLQGHYRVLSWTRMDRSIQAVLENDTHRICIKRMVSGFKRI